MSTKGCKLGSSARPRRRDDLYPWRGVVSVSYTTSRYHAHGARTAEVLLECGHTLSRKASQAPKRRLRCPFCEKDVTP